MCTHTMVSTHMKNEMIMVCRKFSLKRPDEFIHLICLGVFLFFFPSLAFGAADSKCETQLIESYVDHSISKFGIGSDQDMLDQHYLNISKYIYEIEKNKTLSCNINKFVNIEIDLFGVKKKTKLLYNIQYSILSGNYKSCILRIYFSGSDFTKFRGPFLQKCFSKSL